MAKKLIVFKDDEAVKEAAREKAKRKDLTLSQVMRRLLRRWVAENGDEQEEG